MAGRKGYKTLLLEAMALMKKSGATARTRIELLSKVFDDDAFRAESGAVDDFGAAEVLDEYLQDLCVGFLELRQMLKHCPTDPAWETGKLRELHSKTVEILREQASANKPEAPERTRRGVTVAEFEALDRDKQDAEALCRYLEKQQEEEVVKTTTLQDDNRRLREENIRLEGRIEELERIVSKQFEPVGI